MRARGARAGRAGPLQRRDRRAADRRRDNDQTHVSRLLAKHASETVSRRLYSPRSPASRTAPERTPRVVSGSLLPCGLSGGRGLRRPRPPDTDGCGSRGWTDRAPTDARISSSFAGVSAVIADTPAPTRISVGGSRTRGRTPWTWDGALACGIEWNRLAAVGGCAQRALRTVCLARGRSRRSADRSSPAPTTRRTRGRDPARACQPICAGRGPLAPPAGGLDPRHLKGRSDAAALARGGPS